MVDAFGAHLGVRLAESAQVLDPGLFEVQQVVGVVHDAHRIGLGEPDPDAVGEGIVGRVERRARRRVALGAP